MVKQITLIITSMNQCRMCVKTTIINTSASILQQTLESQYVFLSSWIAVGLTYTTSKSVAVALLLRRLTSEAGSSWGLERGEDLLSERVRRSSDKEERRTVALSSGNRKHASQINSLSLRREKPFNQTSC